LTGRASLDVDCVHFTDIGQLIDLLSTPVRGGDRPAV
jgi:hypothetical protein